MARLLTLEALEAPEFRSTMSRSFQSGHINFLIGSGASLPAIPIAGAIEQEIAEAFVAGDDDHGVTLLYNFLQGVQGPTNRLINNTADVNNEQTLGHYKQFVAAIEAILSERRVNLLPKQATIFTTNYDLFVEKAAVSYPGVRLNDGFIRVPSLDNRMEFSSRVFFNTTYNTGNLYNYRVEIPCINLVKLHGSLSWRKDSNDVLFQVSAKAALAAASTVPQKKEYVDTYAVVLPQITKFRTTVLDRTYYELLRIYANELDRENCLLVAFGFSFADEHILDITRRALKNPTLRLMIFAFNGAAQAAYAHKFEAYNNAEIVAAPAPNEIAFGRFNEALRVLLPKAGGA